VTAKNGFGQEMPVSLLVEAAQECTEGRIEAEDLAIRGRENGLVSIYGGKCLNLDQPGDELACGIADEGEISGEEVGMGRFPGDEVAVWNGRARGIETCAIGDEGSCEIRTGGGHLIEEIRRQKYGSFRDSKLNGNSAALLK
jgi:hypothetical protein